MKVSRKLILACLVGLVVNGQHSLVLWKTLVPRPPVGKSLARFRSPLRFGFRLGEVTEQQVDAKVFSVQNVHGELHRFVGVLKSLSTGETVDEVAFEWMHEELTRKINNLEVLA